MSNSSCKLQMCSFYAFVTIAMPPWYLLSVIWAQILLTQLRESRYGNLFPGRKKIPFFVSVGISQKLTGLMPCCGFCCIIILTIIVCLCSHSLSIKRLLMWPVLDIFDLFICMLLFIFCSALAEGKITWRSWRSWRGCWRRRRQKK